VKFNNIYKKDFNVRIRIEMDYLKSDLERLVEYI